MSMYLPERQEVFPHAYGHEMELGLQTNVRGKFDEPYEMADSLYSYLPKGIENVGEMLSNGGRLYVQNSGDKTDGQTNIEWASPECASVKQMVRYIRGGEKFSRQLIAQFTETTAVLLNEEIQARLQMRVIDSDGNTKARHDNYGYADILELKDKAVLSSHLQTRSVVTGAGHVSRDGLAYAQKITGLQFIEEYGWVNSMFRVEDGDESNRLEVRCSDHNISDWAATVRIGSVALALALSKHDLLEPFTCPNYSSISFARASNKFFLDINGTVKPTANALLAIDYQQQLAELSMDKLANETDMPEELFLVAYELYQYCDDFKAFLSGQCGLDRLSDRADWATKFELLLKYRQNDARFSPNASLTDYKAQGFDMFYDRTQFLSDIDSTTVKDGYGYTLRKLHPTRFSISDVDAIRAANKPPADTRASLRSELMKKYHVSYADWEYVKIMKGRRQELRIDMEYPLQTELTAEQLQEISEFFENDNGRSMK